MVTTAQNKNTATAEPPHAKLHEVEELTNDLKRLLVNHEPTLKEEGLRDEVETLERLMESYRSGLTADHKISENGVHSLSDLRDRLRLAAEERMRLEGEGGLALNKEQFKETNDLLETARHIDQAIPDLEQMFSTSIEEEHA